MRLTRRLLQSENDYWRIRNFLRQIFLLHGRHELSWHVARLDYWRWHFIKNLQFCPPIDQVMFLWETTSGRLGAVLHPFGMNEAFLAVHPEFRSPDLEHEMIDLAEDKFSILSDQGERKMYITADDGDMLRQKVLTERGYIQRDQMIHRWWRDLDMTFPQAPVASGYTIRSLGDHSELPARSWASWRAFHPNDPDDHYEGWDWYRNLQSAPLYRRDLDLLAATDTNEIAAFCTIWYDDFTRSAVCVLVGTAHEHQRRGLGKAVIMEGLNRLINLGATRIFANAYDPPADALYGSTLGNKKISHSWLKRF
jgi:GNAT superfamily N-acetyltransferase